MKYDHYVIKTSPFLRAIVTAFEIASVLGAGTVEIDFALAEA